MARILSSGRSLDPTAFAAHSVGTEQCQRLLDLSNPCADNLRPCNSEACWLQKDVTGDGGAVTFSPRLEDALRARVVALTQVAAGKNPETNEAECSKACGSPTDAMSLPCSWT